MSAALRSEMPANDTSRLLELSVGDVERDRQDFEVVEAERHRRLGAEPALESHHREVAAEHAFVAEHLGVDADLLVAHDETTVHRVEPQRLPRRDEDLGSQTQRLRDRLDRHVGGHLVRALPSPHRTRRVDADGAGEVTPAQAGVEASLHEQPTDLRPHPLRSRVPGPRFGHHLTQSAPPAAN